MWLLWTTQSELLTEMYLHSKTLGGLKLTGAESLIL